MTARSLPTSPQRIDILVQKVREKSRASIVLRCGSLKVLDMTQPIGLNDIYISVNILETIVGRRRLEMADLLQDCNQDNFERCGLGRITQERVPGLTAIEKYSKLIVLGKPGAGKTTFLKYLAIQCSLGEFKVAQVPLFITLKDFAEAENQPDLLIYINQLLSSCGVTNAQIVDVLTQGRALILLDGLDEVREEESYQISKQIWEFTERFPKNKFVITCRIAGQEYTFEKFTEVEIADFDLQQIKTFATKWFAAVDPSKRDKFIQKLQDNEPIRELANNPLLLTLLCLIFQEAADFPLNRLELYQEGLSLLLKKWDANKNIERDRVYKKLSVQQKQDLLSQIALTTFEQNKYFFKQKELEQYISDYLHNLPHLNNELEELQTNSKTVLKTIEMQHGLLVERAQGIYSFSHLTFQEYFTARQIVANSYPQLLETALKQLTSRITEKRWREVFLLTGGMFRTADYLLQLMKQRIEQLVAQDEYLQAFLTWANQKSHAVNAPYKPVAIRAFYIALAFTVVLINDNVNLDTALELAGDTLELAFSLDSTFTLDRHAATDLTIDRILALVLARALDLTFERQPTNEFVSGVNLVIKLTVEPELKREAQLSPLSESLLSLKNQLPDLGQDKERFEQWWQVNGQAWTKQLRAVLISQRNIGHDWQFSDQQREILRHYYNANRLLLNCLNSDWYVTRAVRSHIEETLLLPITELKQREFQA